MPVNSAEAIVKAKGEVILGIDPGTLVMGYGLINKSGSALSVVSMGVIHLNKLENHHDKLEKIFERVQFLIREYKPVACAIEAPFFGKNVQSMLKLGRAQGVAIAAAISLNVPVFEYSPKKIKMSITGNGNASKEQVAGMVQRLLKYEQNPSFFDATDAVAAALCYTFQSKLGGVMEEKGAKNWEQFLKKNPSRIIK